MAYRVLELFPKGEDPRLQVVDGLRVLDDQLMFRLRRRSQVCQLPLKLLDLGDGVASSALFHVQLGFQFVDLRIHQPARTCSSVQRVKPWFYVKSMPLQHFCVKHHFNQHISNNDNNNN